MPARRQTQTGKLSELARHVVLPTGIVSTGWPAVRDRCTDLGIAFDPWQDGLGRAILAKRADGLYATTVGGVVISIPRQVGKTFVMGAVTFALCLLHPNTTVLWTAHRLRTAAETFKSMKAMSDRQRIKAHVESPRQGSGEQEIRFRNGSRILFGARERGFGRGFTLVDVVVFDEAQILSDRAIDDMVPAMNQALNPLLLFVGTPPKPDDPSEVFTRKRTDCLSGDADDTLYIEFSADQGARADDRGQWAKANPSYPARTPAAAMQRMRKNLSPESFVREAMGIWDEALVSLVFPPGSWDACASADRPADLRPGALAVAASFDLSHAAVAAAARTTDHLWLRPLRHGPGMGWVVAAVKGYQDEFDVDVVLDKRGPAASLLPKLIEADVRVRLADTADVCDAYDGIYQAVRDGVVRHPDNPVLNAAVAGAVPRSVGDRSTWGRKASTSDISLLESVTLAALEASLPEIPEREVWGVWA